MSRVAIFGASGFVGATLVERLYKDGQHDIVPVIRSAGNAWRLSRFGKPLTTVDLVSGEGLDEALTDVQFVINCTRGAKEVMIDGFSNLLKAAKKHKVEKFVHLSSVMIYGDPPLAETEAVEPVKQTLDTYGGIKAKQDEMLQAAAKEGLPATILVPPNISGPYSAYLGGVLSALNAGTFALMDEGDAPINLVDVENLCQAIELSLTKGRDDGSRYFITDDNDVSWGSMIRDLQELQVSDSELRHISRESLKQMSSAIGPVKRSVGRSLKHLVSSDMREALRKDPLWNKFDLAVRGSISKLGSRVENSLRLSVEGPISVRKRSVMPDIDLRLCEHQLREGRHSIEKARAELGYIPEVSYQQSMQNFQTWYRRLHGLDGEFAELLRQLYV